MKGNVDVKTVEGFGKEWSRFDQSGASESELSEQFERYFSVFSLSQLPTKAVGFDLGCGSGRWAKRIAGNVGKLYCVDASERALEVAKRNLSEYTNVEFHNASVDDLPLAADSMDFGYSLGVLHHVPDTAAGIATCASLLKRGAPFLIYLYYAFDNRPAWFRAIWKTSDILRRAIAFLPFSLKRIVTDLIAVFVYLPLAIFCRVLEKLGFKVEDIPLSAYRRHSFYTMRTDSLDRFGTRLEQRFTKAQIRKMMERAGLKAIRFSEDEPYWCAVGIKG